MIYCTNQRPHSQLLSVQQRDSAELLDVSLRLPRPWHAAPAQNIAYFNRKTTYYNRKFNIIDFNK